MEIQIIFFLEQRGRTTCHFIKKGERCVQWRGQEISVALHTNTQDAKLGCIHARLQDLDNLDQNTLKLTKGVFGLFAHQPSLASPSKESLASGGEPIWLLSKQGKIFLSHIKAAGKTSKRTAQSALLAQPGEASFIKRSKCVLRVRAQQPGEKLEEYGDPRHAP